MREVLSQGHVITAIFSALWRPYRKLYNANIFCGHSQFDDSEVNVVNLKKFFSIFRSKSSV